MYLILVLTLSLGSSFAWAKNKPPRAMRSISDAQKKIILKIDKKYTRSSVQMEVKKKVKMNLLGKLRQTEGKLWLSKGRLRLEMKEPEKALFVVDEKFLWIVNFPPKGFEEATIQVIQTKLSSKRARSQGLIQMLTQGGFFKYFNAVSAVKNKRGFVFFLQPLKTNLEFKRAQMSIDSKGQRIESFSYWDNLDNETTFHFNNVVFGKKIDLKKFSYSPPKGAEIVVY